jgi:hypothetical protein
VVSFTPLLLSLYGRLHGPQSRYGPYGVKKDISNLPIIEPHPLGRPARSVFAIPTKLSQFTRTVACLFLISAVPKAGDRIIRQRIYG